MGFNYGTEEIKDLTGNHAVQFSKNIRVEVRSYTKKTRTSYVSRAQTNSDGKLTQTTSAKTVTSSPKFGTTESLSVAHLANGTTVATITDTSGGPATGNTGFASDSGLATYVFYVNNKTPAQCDVMAQQIWRQISQFENAIELTAPMTARLLPLVDITNELALFNVPYSSLNDTYWPRKITETFDPERGWELVFSAVNHENPAGNVSV